MGGQISFFDGTERLRITNPVRLIELFAGIGAQAKAFENLGVPFEHYRICEFDKYAVQSYNAIHGTNFSTSDITQITAEDLGVVDTDKFTYLLTYSFPCFPKGSLVLTENGYRDISDIVPGDMVLAHDNAYHKVVASKQTGTKQVFKISAMSVDEIRATENHRFLTRKRKRVGHFSKRVFDNPEWKELKDLTTSDYLGVAINQCSEIPQWDGIDFVWSDGRASRHKNELSPLMGNKDLWWIIGRYLGDGWQRKGGIIICCNKAETAELQSRIRKCFHCTIASEQTVDKIHISSSELNKFVSQFGKGATNKHLTKTVINLPTDLLKELIEGYMSADGCITEGVCKATTVSRELAYGIAECVAKVYKTPYRIYKTLRTPISKIEGREVHQNATYQLVYKINKCKQDKAFYEDGYVWFPIRSITPDSIESVYDIEVEDAHSFTVQNTIVHNCQDLSLAGKRAGIKEGTRSGLLLEVERLLKEMKELPQILYMENVPQVLTDPHFPSWLRFLESLGYTNKWEVMNATDYGIPQHRERAFMISFLGNYYYDFPEGERLKTRLKHYLEDEVEEKYYLSQKAVEGLCRQMENT